MRSYIQQEEPEHVRHQNDTIVTKAIKWTPVEQTNTTNRKRWFTSRLRQSRFFFSCDIKLSTHTKRPSLPASVRDKKGTVIKHRTVRVNKPRGNKGSETKQRLVLCESFGERVHERTSRGANTENQVMRLLFSKIIVMLLSPFIFLYFFTVGGLRSGTPTTPPKEHGL